MKQEYTLLAADELPIHYLLNKNNSTTPSSLLSPLSSLMLSAISTYPEASKMMMNGKFPVLLAIEKKQPEDVILALINAYPEVRCF